jgi:DNA-3-methyladenine glycosylase I
MEVYHDQEWGVPEHDDRALFEKLILDGFQAGLSWQIILHKRQAFREAFDGFDPEVIARYGEKERALLLADEGIVRNRQKIDATISNARAYLDLRAKMGSFDEFLWQFTGHQTLKAAPRGDWSTLPTRSPESEAMARALKAQGFKFVGPTICYAFMQAIGMVDDHLEYCFRA